MTIPESLTRQMGAAIADSGTQRALVAQVAIGMMIHPRRWVKTVASTATPESLTDFAISAITHVGTVATATATAHQLVTGDSVTIRGASPTPYVGTFTVTVVDANTFTFTLLIDPGADASGTIIGNVLILTARVEMLNTAGSGTGHYGVVSGNGNQLFQIPFGTVATLQSPSNRVFPLGDFYYDANGNGEGVDLLIYPSYNPM